MARGSARDNDRKGSPVPKKNGVRIVGAGGDSQSLGKGKNAGEFGVGSGYGPPGTDKPRGKIY